MEGGAEQFAQGWIESVVGQHGGEFAWLSGGAPISAMARTLPMLRPGLIALAVAAGIGFAVSAVAFLLGGAYLVRGIVVDSRVPGWTSLMVLLAIFNGFLIALVSMLGEYVLRTLTAEDLKELGVGSLGHRKRLLAAIAELDGAARPEPAPALEPRAPRHLAEQALRSRAALEGERKQVTVLFADLKGSMELLADRDPEEARKLLDPVLERMMEAVHRYEGTVNQAEHGADFGFLTATGSLG